MKRWFCVAAAVLLCLTLAACEGDNSSNGATKWGPVNELAEAVHYQSYEKALWNLSIVAASEEGGAGAAELSEQYPELKNFLGWVEAGEYGKAAKYINEQQIAVLKEQPDSVGVNWDWLADFFGTWEPKVYDDGKPAENNLGSVELNEDGTLRIQDQTMFWMIDSAEIIDDTSFYVNLYVYQGEKHYCQISVNRWITTGWLQMSIHFDGYGLEYTKGEAADELSGTWYNVLQNNSVVNLDKTGQLRIDGKDHTFEIVSDEAGIKVLKVPGAGVEITVSKRDEYPVMTMKYDNGTTELYYFAQTGYDENWPEILYHDALKLLQLWQEDKNDRLNWKDQYYTRQEVLHMAYTKLVSCKGHADAAAYIKRFTVKKDVLIRVEDPEPNTADHETYVYDDNGRLVQFYGVHKELEKLTFEEYGNTVYRMTYDSKDRVKTISWEAWTFHYDQLKRVQCSATYNYNNQGRVQQIDLQLKDDTCRVEYLYDFNGTLLQMHYEFGSVVSDQEEGFFRDFYYLWATPEEGLVIADSWDLPRSTGTVNYSYDTMGNVIEESWAIDRKNVGEVPTLTANITRTYDSEGRLIKKVYTDIHGDTRTTEYTYDSAGKLSYAVETGDNLSVDKIEYNYVYANIYTFK